MNKKFTRTIEHFTCHHCSTQVSGNGYTNHCPECLWSKHVDINPGDRLESCSGLMEPISVELKKGTYIITHRCQRCQFTRKNKTSPEDSFECILELVRTGKFFG